MTLTSAEQKKLLPQIQLTVDALEEVLNSGLTTASDSTSKALGVTFQSAARLRLLRLASTLRSTNDEINRYVNDDKDFSQTRLMFFLNRSWLLCKGLKHAIETNDKKRLAALLMTPETKNVKQLQVVCLGVSKKIAGGNFCAFEFRLRCVKTREPFVWSTVFPMKPGNAIPAEGYLHLPQKQKFAANVFLEKRVLQLSDFVLSVSGNGVKRIQFADQSTVESQDKFDDWKPFLKWDPSLAVKRIAEQNVTPFDLETELQEEVFFSDFELEKAVPQKDKNRNVFPLIYKDTQFALLVSDGEEGKAARETLAALQKKRESNVTMFGLMHYSNCRLEVQPLTLFNNDDNDLEYVTISKKSIDKRALLAEMKFT